MNFTEFEQFPRDARLWIYGLDRSMDSETREQVAARLASFTADWKSHQVPVTGTFAIFEDRFILLSGYCNDGISGCSTDSSVHVIRALQELGLDGLNRDLVFYRDNGAVAALPRSEFRNAVRDGAITPDTTVFDLTLQTVADLDQFETTFQDSWHAKAFG